MKKEISAKKKRTAVLCGLGAAVVASTVLILTKPASSMSNDTYCGYEEHFHDDSCYVVSEVLACGLEESEGHLHDAACFDEEGNLICTIPEAMPHVHDSSCYAQQKTLICDRPVHTHSLQCYSNPKADLESITDWEDSFRKLELTGMWSDDVVTVAETQLGYEESKLNYQVGENNAVSGITRYGEYFGNPYGDWSSMFCGFCMNFAKVDGALMPYDADVNQWMQKLSDAQLLTDASYIPSKGDVVFLELTEDITVEAEAESYDAALPAEEAAAPAEVYAESEAVSEEIPVMEEIPVADGIPVVEDIPVVDVPLAEEIPVAGDIPVVEEAPVAEAEPVTQVISVTRRIPAIVSYVGTDDSGALFFNAIGEISKGSVSKGAYFLNDSAILGYGRMALNPNFGKEEEAEIQEIGIVTIESEPAEDGVIAVVSGKLPTGAYVTIEKVFLSEEEVLKYFGDKAGSIENMFSYDIKIMVNGEEWQPDETVSVTMKNLGSEFTENASLEMKHVDGSTDEASDVNVNVNDSGDVIFDAEGFSVYIGATLQDAPASTTYWEKVTNLSQITDNVGTMLFVYENKALTYGTTGSKATPGLSAVEGQTGYYSSSTLTEKSFWNYSRQDSKFYFSNASDSSQKIESNSNLFSSTANGITLYTESDYPGQFFLTYLTKRNGNTTYHSISYNSSRSSRSFIVSTDEWVPFDVYLLVDNPVPTPTPDPGPDPVNPGTVDIQPTYKAYKEVSEAKAEDTQLGSVAGRAYSDAATSNLETRFEGKAADDGKVLTDKSVVYGKDDYGAFSSYNPNTFGVTLSALGQKYMLDESYEVSAPLDVVYILDVSGSMTNGNGDNKGAIKMTDALNKSVRSVLTANPDNRIGVVAFSNTSEEILPLDRYSVTNANDNYFTVDTSGESGTVIVASNVKNSNGDSKAGATYQYGWSGTYTQSGIARGAQTFMNVPQSDISVTHSIESKDGDGTITYTVNRRPVFILLSDGEPTYCTDDYKNVLNTSTVYGSGVYTNTTNNIGIHGYYTILSANYYKNQVEGHYRSQAYFFTIGSGINATGTLSANSSSKAGDDYKRAVLNPTIDAISGLNTCDDGKGSHITGSGNSGIVGNTCRLLYQLLNNTYSGSTVTVESKNKNDSAGITENRSSSAKVIKNPYINSNYSYADGAYFGADVSAITAGLETSLTEVRNQKVYGFILRKNSSMSVTDVIGDGMELKSWPMLNIDGVNYEPVAADKKLPAASGTTVYHYEGIKEVKDVNNHPDNSGQKIDLSKITATVSYENGNQKVVFTLADDAVPTYMPSLKLDNTVNFYFESLPARLIYQVGLTADSEKDVKALYGTTETRTYYTNVWDDSGASESAMKPSVHNTYYGNEQYKTRDSLEKTGHITETKDNAAAISSSTADGDLLVKADLGNNGKLVFTGTKIPDPPPGKKAPDKSKVIDALRTGTDNKDTDLDNKDIDLTDLYRLYLNVGPESSLDAVDILFIIDSSTSMNGANEDSNDATDINGNTGLFRSYALDTLMNGEAENAKPAKPTSWTWRGWSGGTKNQQDNLYANGILAHIKAMNPENKVAVARFSQTSENVYPFSDGWLTAKDINSPISYSNVSGTNYAAGLQQAKKLLDSVKNDGNQKIMIFLSDGQPTYCYGNSKDKSGDFYSTNLWGSGSENQPEHDATMTVINQFKSDAVIKPMIDSGDLTIYTIGVGDWEPDLLNMLSTGNKTYKSSNFQNILNDIDNKITRYAGHYSNMYVKDTLSNYVDFYTDDLDLLVTKVHRNSTDGQGTVLYQNGSLTEAGAAILKPITDDWQTSGVYVDYGSKTVYMRFLDDFHEEPGYLYSLSFNVKATQKAYDLYNANEIAGKNPYTDDNSVTRPDHESPIVMKGDSSTDYTFNGNDTSSDKPGFYSNQEAVLHYTQTLAGEEPKTYESPYDDPVIQVSNQSFAVTKNWADKDYKDHARANSTVTVQLYRTVGTGDAATTTPVGDPVELNKNNNWTYTWPKLVSGVDHGYSYSVQELKVNGKDVTDSGYVVSYSEITQNGTASSQTITNSPATADVIFQKVGYNGNSTVEIKVAGIEFEVYESDAAGNMTSTKFGTKFVTDEDGKVKIEGLTLGKQYWLLETKSPPGYELMKQARPFTAVMTLVDGKPVVSVNVTSDDSYLKVVDGELTVVNYSGYELPKSGGEGTARIMTLGVLLVTASALMYVYSLRRKKEGRAE